MTKKKSRNLKLVLVSAVGLILVAAAMVAILGYNAQYPSGGVQGNITINGTEVQIISVNPWMVSARDVDWLSSPYVIPVLIESMTCALAGVCAVGLILDYKKWQAWAAGISGVLIATFLTLGTKYFWDVDTTLGAFFHEGDGLIQLIMAWISAIVYAVLITLLIYGTGHIIKEGSK